MFKLDLPPKEERIFQLTEFQEEFLQHLLQYKFEITDKRSQNYFPFIESTAYAYSNDDIIKYDLNRYFFEDPYLIENNEKFKESLITNPIPTQKLVEILRKDLKGFTISIRQVYYNATMIIVGWN